MNGYRRSQTNRKVGSLSEIVANSLSIFLAISFWWLVRWLVDGLRFLIGSWLLEDYDTMMVGYQGFPQWITITIPTGSRTSRYHQPTGFLETAPDKEKWKRFTETAHTCTVLDGFVWNRGYTILSLIRHVYKYDKFVLTKREVCSNWGIPNHPF